MIEAVREERKQSEHRLNQAIKQYFTTFAR